METDKLTQAEKEFLQERTCFDSKGKKHIVYLNQHEATINDIVSKVPELKQFLIKYEPNKYF